MEQSTKNNPCLAMKTKGPTGTTRLFTTSVDGIGDAYGGTEVRMKAPYSNLVAWRRADDLFVEIHTLTLKIFPAHEKYELGGQLRRSAYSVPANIVEGNGRESPKDSRKFFNIASASLSEVGYGLHAAHRLGYFDTQTYERLDLLVRQAAAPLNGLLRRLRHGEKLLSQAPHPREVRSARER